ncbi:hypothetical protein AYM40_25225 [Paraburkholderia phytofirmans OLGA172]|uniref:Alpha glucuronidase N-terminal domain-containing protein n=1 Tax=Paraburkholderia phytofirmans OLGA172 TaxID=1417228 RepID=A0A160FSF8_9BURK|nr:DUF4838 domain-containing protein [Paraburkholderia phytofirmans]ANB75646.1 hypothetical protein AYM40_25225 [Paraburkholderia phytofirmans OLGA172]
MWRLTILAVFASVYIYVVAGCAAPRAQVAGTAALPARQAFATLADNGQAHYVIRAGAVDAVTRHAADELADYLSRISNARFVVLEDGASDLPVIVVGGQGAVQHCTAGREAALGDDGFVICQWSGDLVIAGNTPRGTLFGVYWWLDRQLGVKWLAPDAVEVPVKRTLRVSTAGIRQKPRFAYREVLSAEGEDKAFRAHNLLNGESHGTSFRPSPSGIDMWDHSWLARGGDFDFWTLVPRSRYGATHPDWFGGGQLAMMSPDVRRVMAQEIVQRLQTPNAPKKIWFGIHDMDWGWDMDASSRAFVDAHGGAPSAAFLDMVGDVASRVRQSVPDARVAMPAYHWGFAPPEGMTVPDDVLVYPMTIQVDYSSALNEGRNASLGQGIRRWNEIARHVLVWDHIVNFGGYLQPTPNLYPIGRSIAWLATLPHVEGYFGEGDWQSRGGEFSSLRVWLIARQLWSPSEDVRALVREYCNAYYGAAGPAITRYIDRMHEAVRVTGDVLAEQTPIDAPMYTYGFVRQSDQDFDSAERAVADDPTKLARVRQARMPLDVVILALRARYAERAREGGWDMDIPVRKARLLAALAVEHTTKYRQSGDLSALRDLLDVAWHPSAAPAIVSALTTADWQEIGALKLNLYDSARVVTDTEAAHGGAVSLRGDSEAWAVQLKFDKLPRGGNWDLFAEVRVPDATLAPPAAAIRVGAYPPMTRRIDTPVRALPGSAYGWLPVPGGPFSYGTDHERGAYVHGVGFAKGQTLLIDRFVAIRHDAATAATSAMLNGTAP